ncbi:hypothetical protein MW887_009923 [Aspergillus wentii]|nr:hypothetical protein MW887_009923 [Aspergillus wentii]
MSEHEEFKVPLQKFNMKPSALLLSLVLPFARAADGDDCKGATCSATARPQCTSCDVQYTIYSTTRDPKVTSTDVATACSWVSTKPCSAPTSGGGGGGGGGGGNIVT